LHIKIYRFRDCFLNFVERRVFKDGKYLELTPKSFEVLLLLVENAGEIVTKDEILDRVWKSHFVEEGNLPVQISKLRKSIGETNAKRYIETVQGTGYRFVAPVDEISHEKWDELVSGRFHSTPFSDHSSPSKAQTRISESHRLYLKGLHFLKKRNESDVYRAIELFEQSAAKDPAHVLAYIELVESYLLLYTMDQISYADVSAKISPYAAIIRDLDIDVDAAYVMRAGIAMYIDWAFDKAEVQLKRALELDRSEVFTIFRYVNLLVLTGRFTDALLELQQVMHIDPLSVSTYKRNGRLFYKMKRFDSSIEYLREALELEPNDYETLLLLGASLTETGEYNKAVDLFLRSLDVHETMEGLSMIGYVHARAGDKKKAYQLIDQINADQRPGVSHAVRIARIHSALGEKTTAFSLLDRAFEFHDLDLIWLSIDPRWFGIASDPRFADLEARIGLGESEKDLSS
jgi:DNA-binding winged helix-turn-helix (wHTH) protein/Tfp pilus assembly protein PilF